MSATFAARASGAGSFNPQKIPGTFFDALIEVTGDASYPTGGYAFGAAQLQTLFGGAYSVVESVEVVNPWISSTPTVYTAAYNKGTGKVQAFGTGATAGAAVAYLEVTAATNLSTFTCTLRVRFA